MSMPRKLLTIVGARPQFVKAAAVSRALRERERLQEIMVHTGQHFDDAMSEIFFRELDIPRPRHNLGVHGGGHGQMTGRMLERIEEVLLHEQPRAVVVYGDTNSTLAGALAASKLRLPVVHVEAGLRSFNRAMPEEINRVLTDHISDVLFCPTRTAVENLGTEGVVQAVLHCGDVMYDATLYALSVARERSDILARLNLEPGRYAVATVHRAENTEQAHALEAVLNYLNGQARQQPVVLPLHPRTREAARTFGCDLSELQVCHPLGYIDMTMLVANAAAVYTDSGGLQKEAYFHRVPCVTLREQTEWVETVTAGWNRLWRVPGYQTRCEISDYGYGEASAIIAAELDARYGS